eukprot:CAMPEP_0113849474 /NCGR_PEP_ID=MMETSP0372-20130328/3167_1 /TAXON_ID=340204 /ORGANISM="Lankesteria abbotti" /LENGTH=171 /DNA_ID=CAMNT_0000819301 /DNA_START=336 /DNA_END=851 /DNA_ORIENTATION=- /assembly_acc=CAM_ASM_000359
MPCFNQYALVVLLDLFNGAITADMPKALTRKSSTSRQTLTAASAGHILASFVSASAAGSSPQLLVVERRRTDVSLPSTTFPTSVSSTTFPTSVSSTTFPTSVSSTTFPTSVSSTTFPRCTLSHPDQCHHVQWNFLLSPSLPLTCHLVQPGVLVPSPFLRRMFDITMCLKNE